MSLDVNYQFFLGGTDLEMLTIQQLLIAQGLEFVDGGLSWGAKASSYLTEIRASFARGRVPVLIELELDIPADLISKCVIVDHHGSKAGKDVATSLEQVYTLLQLQESLWSRHFQLVAANDRGHIRAMRLLVPPASDSEIRTIREADIRAQGATDADLAEARDAASSAEMRCNGRLTVARTSGHQGLVAEFLETFFGGPGFHNLMVIGSHSTSFFGEGRWVQRLAGLSPPSPLSWFGGSLPDFGFWGAEASGLAFDPLASVESWLGAESTGGVGSRTSG